MTANLSPVLEVVGLSKHFAARRTRKDAIVAVREASFVINPSESLGVVGASGSGKTTLMRSILRLIDPTAGIVKFQGTDLVPLKGSSLRRARRGMQAVFQDPRNSLDSRTSLFDSVSEPLRVFDNPSKDAMQESVRRALELVGLPIDPMRKPNSLSGGQLQRVAIARALISNPTLMVLDEATSSLDVSSQAEILNLLLDLRAELALSMVVIAHNFAVINVLCERVLVMDQGEIVERGETQQILTDPVHRYTRQLIEAARISDRYRS